MSEGVFPKTMEFLFFFVFPGEWFQEFPRTIVEAASVDIGIHSSVSIFVSLDALVVSSPLETFLVLDYCFTLVYNLNQLSPVEPSGSTFSIRFV